MTAIATFLIKERPVIFSDVLLSGLEQGTAKLTLPSVGHISNVFPEGSGYLPQALSQKITIVSDNCGLAWAGSWLVARVVINKVFEAFRARRLAIDEIVKLIVEDEDFQNDHHQTAILGWVVSEPDEAGKFTMEQFFVNGDTNGKNWPEQIVYAGSGGELLSQLIEHTNVGRSNREMHRNVEIAATGINLLARLYQLEYVGKENAPTLTHFFGGGFEFAFWDEQRFQKVDGFTLILWEAQLDKGKARLGIAPALVVRQVYIDGYLFVRSSRYLMNHPERQGEILSEMNVNCIPPMISGLARPNVSEADIPFNSTFIATIVWILTPDGPMYYHAVEETDKIVAEQTSFGFSFDFRDGYLDGLLGRVEAVARNAFEDSKLGRDIPSLPDQSKVPRNVRAPMNRKRKKRHRIRR